MGLEQTIEKAEKSFFSRVGNRIKINVGTMARMAHTIAHSLAGRISRYSLIGVLGVSAGTVGYGCHDTCWERTLGWEKKHDTIHTIKQTRDGGYIAVGLMNATRNSHETLVLKLDEKGTKVWSKTFEGMSTLINSTQQTSDGGYIVASDGTYVIGGHKIVAIGKSEGSVLKFDSAGNVQWRKTVRKGNDVANSIQQTADEGYIVAGAMFPKDREGHSNALIFKLDKSGNKEWERSIESAGSASFSVAHSIRQTTEGGYIAIGVTYEHVGDSIERQIPWGGPTKQREIWILKLDSAGELEWNNAFEGGRIISHLYSVEQTKDRGYIVAGSLNLKGATMESEGRTLGDVWVVKLDKNGGKTWEKTFGGNNRIDEGRSIQQTQEGGYIVAGKTNSKGMDNLAWLLKLDKEGNLEWDKTFRAGGVGLNTEAWTVRQTGDKGYIVGGLMDSKSTKGYNDAWILKLDKEGNLNCR